MKSETKTQEQGLAQASGNGGKNFLFKIYDDIDAKMQDAEEMERKI